MRHAFALHKNSTPSEILRFADDYTDKTWNYIILGRTGPTGKTYLCNLLKSNGYNAMEINERIYDLIEYHRNGTNHFRVDTLRKQVVIVLNRSLRKTEDGYCWR